MVTGLQYTYNPPLYFNPYMQYHAEGEGASLLDFDDDTLYDYLCGPAPAPEDVQSKSLTSTVR